MNLEKFINDTIFEVEGKNKVFYDLVWSQFIEDGFVIVDSDGCEIDSVFKAVALINILNEFSYRLYDSVNETEPEDAIRFLEQLGIQNDEIDEYIKSDSEAFCEGDNFEDDLKCYFDYETEIVADKLLEDYTAEALFDLMFATTYEFEQDFVFDFEDSDELCAFVDANSEKLDIYRTEFSSVYDWIESGMVC